MIKTRLSIFAMVLLLTFISAETWADNGYPYRPYQQFDSPPNNDEFNYRFQHHYSNSIRIERGMNEKGYVVRVYPGGNMKAEDISATAQPGRLRLESVRGQQDSWQDDTGSVRGYFRSNSMSSFSRSIRLPRDANIEKMTSQVVDGVLVVELPKMMPVYR